MHAFLLINSDPTKLAKKENAEAIEHELQKIEDVRELKKIVKFSFNKKTAIVINDIDKATIECLNAFLKNLEEPNKNIIYILTATNISNVLPTIVSRCQVISEAGKSIVSDDVNQKELHFFLNEKIQKKFEILAKIKEREEAVLFLNNLIYLEYKNSKYENMEYYLETLNNLKLNGNVSLQLTNLVAKMNSRG